MKWIALSALSALFCLQGCAFIKDRAKDATEICEVGVGFSMGFDVNLRATKCLQVGLGSYSGSWIGLREGWFTGWEEERVEWGLSPLYFHELNREGGRLLCIRHPLPGELGYADLPNDFFLLSDRGFFEFGITVNLIALGVDLAFDGAEFADFATGWFGADLLADDCYARPLSDLINQTQSQNSWKRAAAVRALRRMTGQNFGYTVVTPREAHPPSQIAAWRKWRAYRDQL